MPNPDEAHFSSARSNIAASGPEEKKVVRAGHSLVSRAADGNLPRIVILLGLGMVTFAFAPILVRTAGDTDPLAFAAIRTVSAALIILPFWLFRYFRGRTTGGVYDRRDTFVAAIAGMTLGLHLIFWIMAVQNTSIASASVLVTIHPIILILIEAGFFRRIFPPLVWTGVFVAFSGSVLLGYSDAGFQNDFDHALIGDLYALVAAFLFAIYFLFSQRLRQKSDWLNYVFRVYGFTGITCLLIALLAGSNFQVGAVPFIAAVAMAAGPQVIGHGSMNYAVKYVAPTMLATLILAEPVFATILAWLLFTEIPPTLTFLAMAVVLAGVIMAWSARWNKP